MPLVGCISWSLVGRNWQLVVPSERTSEFRGKRSKLRFWSEELKVLFWIWLMLILKPSWHSAWLVTWSTRAPCCFCQHARGTIKAALTIITLAGVEDLLRLQCWHQRRTLIFAFFLLYCFTAASSRVSFVVIKKASSVLALGLSMDWKANKVFLHAGSLAVANPLAYGLIKSNQLKL